MSDIHENIENKLQYFYDNNEIPHIIFHGSSGSGKKTIVHKFLNKIYKNSKSIKENVMYVNCSQGKGIKFIREELKLFAKTNLSVGIQFKTIVLLNADSLTTDAQSALRRCIELFSYNTRFFIIVENKNKLLNPILSRFCEIYVPQMLVFCQSSAAFGQSPLGQSAIDLHQYTIENVLNFKDEKERKQSWIQNKWKELPHEPTHSQLVLLANQFYEQGLSCLDFIDFISSGWNQSSLTMIYFYKIKSEFRCEKILLFSLFDFYFYGSHERLVSIGKV
jgi:hypothetical protein